MSRETPDNPFQKLAEALAKRGRDAQKRAAAPLRDPQPEKGRPESTDCDEAALFLDAVSRIKPLGRKSASRADKTDQSLAELLRAGQGTGQGAGRKAGRGVGQGTGPDEGLGAGRKAGQAGQGAGQAGGRVVISDPAGTLAQVGTLGENPAGAQTEAKGPAPAKALAGAKARARVKTLPQAPAFGTQDDPAAEALEEDIFARAVQGVRPLSGGGRDLAPVAEKKPAAPGLDPAEALREILEGRVEFALRHTDEYQEGFVVGLDPLVLSRLRAGRYSPEKHIDLHGLNARQAHDALTHFIKSAYQRNMRCVVVVTGRGRNSPDGVGVLRPLLQDWLSRDPFKRVVLAFCTAKPGDGGPGAVYVLLRKYKKSRGKIVWERRPGDDDFPDL